jgi:hypothetical protein
LHKSSKVLEWGPVSEGYPDVERYPGMGPYDTGAALGSWVPCPGAGSTAAVVLRVPDGSA